jgi:flavodoxin
MMNVLVVYESMYGNTGRVAKAVSAGVGERFPVDMKTIGEIDQLPADLDVLIVGGPTYAHGVEAAMKAFLDGLPAGSLEGTATASFDTRLNWPRFLSGAASKGIAERLERKGGRMIIEPESFIVEDKDGPLLDGEEERAEAWGRHLATLISPVTRQ